MGKGLSRSWFEKIAGPGIVEAFDRQPVICPECRGERRGEDGALCKRCGGNAQIKRSDLRRDEVAPFQEDRDL